MLQFLRIWCYSGVHHAFCPFPLQQIDEMLAGSFTVEDEDAILAELDAITQVSV